MLFPLLSIGQIKVQSLTTTTVGTSGDFLIKDKAAGGAGGTQKITIDRFIRTYSLVTTYSVNPAVNDRTVTISTVGTITVTGTYPSFTLNVSGSTSSATTQTITIFGVGSVTVTSNLGGNYGTTFTVSVASTTNYIRNGGNSFGGATTIGTNDNFALSFKTNNSTRMSIGTNSLVSITGSLLTTNSISATNLTASGNINANTLNVSGNVTLNGISYSYPASGGSAGQTWINNGSNSLTWGTPSSSPPVGSDGDLQFVTTGALNGNSFMNYNGSALNINSPSYTTGLFNVGKSGDGVYTYFSENSNPYSYIQMGSRSGNQIYFDLATGGGGVAASLDPYNGNYFKCFSSSGTAVKAQNNSGGNQFVGNNGSGDVFVVDANGNTTINGTLYVSGKITAVSGVDPPYVLYDAQTRASVKAKVLAEIPSNKQTGASLYYNPSNHRMEIYVASEDKFYDMSGSLIE